MSKLPSLIEEGDPPHSDLADKLGAAFGASAEFWLNLDWMFWAWKASVDSREKE